MEGQPEGSRQPAAAAAPAPSTCTLAFTGSQGVEKGISGWGFCPSWSSLLRSKNAPYVFKEVPVGSTGGRKVKVISWC